MCGVITPRKLVVQRGDVDQRFTEKENPPKHRDDRNKDQRDINHDRRDLIEQIRDAVPRESLEGGIGLGSLTRYLCIEAHEVVTVELDRKLTPILRSVLQPYHNVRIVEGDILGLSPGELRLTEGYIVAANIPYNITSALLRHLLSSDPKPRRMVLTVQKEVAERICSTPPNMSLLALSVQVFGEPRVVANIPARAFFPAPKVDSAVVRIEILPSPRIDVAVLPISFELMKAGFSQKRKMLRNALAAGMHMPPSRATELLEKAGIDPQRRAETVSLQEWEALARVQVAQTRGDR